MKRKFAFVAALLLAALAYAACAYADGACGANLTWTLTDGVLTIGGTGDMDDWFINTPWSEQKEEIKRVVIEDGVTSIGEYAFYWCSEM